MRMMSFTSYLANLCKMQRLHSMSEGSIKKEIIGDQMIIVLLITSYSNNKYEFSRILHSFNFKAFTKCS